MKYYIDTDRKEITLHSDIKFGDLHKAVITASMDDKAKDFNDFIVKPQILPRIDIDLFQDFDASDDYYKPNVSSTFTA